MNWKFYKRNSTLFPFRWTIIVALVLNILLAYANLTGWRILSSNSQQQWAAKGPGYHK